MMATLPGTVPRMVRPAPGQNYPRTGFPLEGKEGDKECFFFGLVFEPSVVARCVSPQM